MKMFLCFVEFVQPRLPSLDLKMFSFDIEDKFDSIKSLAKEMSFDQVVKSINAMKGVEKSRLQTDSKYNWELADTLNRPHSLNAPVNPYNIALGQGWVDQNQLMASPMISPRSDGSITPPEDLGREFSSPHYLPNGKFYTHQVAGDC